MSVILQTKSRPSPTTFVAAGEVDAVTPSAAHRPSARTVLVTELFPPTIGGSAVLFEAVYSRLDTEVAVFTDQRLAPVAESVQRGMRIVRRPIASPRWGLLNCEGFVQHVRIVHGIRTLTRGGATIVHCARALPEGMAALVSRRFRGPDYICWVHGEDVSNALSSRELTFLMKHVYRAAAALIANSTNTARLVENLGLPPRDIHIVHPGVDPDRFHPHVDATKIRRQFAPSGEILLLSVARLQRHKGHDLAIAAIGKLRDELSDLRYLIVGDGMERARLEALAVEHGVRDRVIFVGEVSPNDLPAYYAACDIFVLPNRIDAGNLEGFGIVFLEAASSARPAIGGSSGGVPDAVEDGVTGLLVSGTDTAELAAAIRRLTLSPELGCRMGRAGRARVLRSFTWERAAAAVSALHQRLAGSR